LKKHDARPNTHARANRCDKHEVAKDSVWVSCGSALSGFAQQQDLTQLSLDDLMNTKVNSASKQAESLCGAPAAIYVTEEDIRRGGFQGDLAI
jgi:hypothetical protein